MELSSPERVATMCSIKETPDPLDLRDAGKIFDASSVLQQKVSS